MTNIVAPHFLVYIQYFLKINLKVKVIIYTPPIAILQTKSFIINKTNFNIYWIFLIIYLNLKVISTKPNHNLQFFSYLSLYISDTSITSLKSPLNRNRHSTYIYVTACNDIEKNVYIWCVCVYVRKTEFYIYFDGLVTIHHLTHHHLWECCWWFISVLEEKKNLFLPLSTSYISTSQ